MSGGIRQAEYSSSVTCQLTDGLGAHSVIEAVGTQEAMMQAIHSTRPGGHVGSWACPTTSPGRRALTAGVHIHGGPAPVRRFLLQLIWDRRIDPGKVLDLVLPLDRAAEAAPRWTSAPPPRCCCSRDRHGP